MLSNYPPYYRLGFQYPALVVPFIHVSLIRGMEKLNMPGKNGVSLRAVLMALIVVNAASCVALSPLSPFTDGFNLSPAYIKPNASQRNHRLTEILALVPPDASVLTQDNIFPHVSNRLDAYVIVPDIHDDPETLLRSHKILWTLKADYILIDERTDPHGTYRYAISIVEETGAYTLDDSYDTIQLYVRKTHLDD
jgi:uncharacterized membrane protein